MRILHTSDWHLGRTFKGLDLYDDQVAFIDHLVTVVLEHDVDALLVSGDIYDRSVPSVQTVGMLAAALARLSAHTTVILTPGNHDSAIRLGFAAELMHDNLRILADVGRIGEPVVLGDNLVRIYGIPYLDPETARAALVPAGAELPARTHEGVLTAAMDIVRRDVAARAGDAVTLVMAHAFVTGGAVSESERDVTVGGVDSAPVGVFDGVDYVALGHLHNPQQIATPAGGPTVCYSGSPLAYSFSEAGRKKSSTLLDIVDGTVTVTRIDVPTPRRIAKLRGTMADILGPGHDHLDGALLQVRVTDSSYPDQMFARVKARFPDAVDIQHDPEGAPQQASAPKVDAGTDPMTVLAEFVEYASGEPPSDAELAVLQHAYDAVRAARRSA